MIFARNDGAAAAAAAFRSPITGCKIATFPDFQKLSAAMTCPRPLLLPLPLLLLAFLTIEQLPAIGI
jgi:hypothetical protein